MRTRKTKMRDRTMRTRRIRGREKTSSKKENLITGKLIDLGGGQ